MDLARVFAVDGLRWTSYGSHVVASDSAEDAFVMGLTENIARRQCRSIERLAGIRQLRQQGYAPAVTAEKTGLTSRYVHGILTLLRWSGK